MERVAGHAGGHEALDKARRFGRALLADPVETLLYLPEEWSRFGDHPVPYRVEAGWEAQLHGLLDAPWPCPEAARVVHVWDQVSEELRRRGLEFGRHTYGHFSDADASLVRAVWCTVLHLSPSVVVETGVARGVTSRVVLEAMRLNGVGHLWSVDLPYPFERDLRGQTGAAVPGYCRGRWTYVEGSSRRRLPAVLRSLGRVDLFVHDSLHTARNTWFEMDRVSRVLRPGGIMVVDDISTHQGFDRWVREAAPGARSLVCPSADGQGLFGIVRV